MGGILLLSNGDAPTVDRAGAAVLGWTLVGVVGGVIETTTAFFVPVWVWVVGALAVTGGSVLLAYSDAVTPS